MLKVILIQPGATDLDDQGRIKGSLDVPLNKHGATQVARTVDELARFPIDVIYASPCTSARQTADALRDAGRRVKFDERLRNVDHGLWHGKRIAEVKQNQPKVYRQCQDHPEEVCPPQGESFDAARTRVAPLIRRIARKYQGSTVALVVPQPMAAVVKCVLQNRPLEDLWKSEQDGGGWEIIEVEGPALADPLAESSPTR